MIESVKQGKFLVVTIPDDWKHYTIEGIFKDYWKVPKKMIHEWRMGKAVTVNDQKIPWTSLLKPGDRLAVPVFEDTDDLVAATDLQISILYEDEHLLIVNKPPGMDTHPNSAGQADTLMNGVAHYLLSTEQPTMAKHIHRLDKDTSGAVLFAKNRLSGVMLDKMLEERKIHRTYLAIVHGLLSKAKGTINEKIGRDRHHPTRRRVSPTGQTAITHFRVLERDPKKKLTIVKCSLESGRTHQIRVHFSHIGHPLAGDVLYGGKAVFPRQALHAYKISFIHPVTEEPIECIAPFLDSVPIFPDFPLP
ncbi:RluA family pseudouridine synthase [Bacillus sp. V5-8f]|uniref:RluA family pseudouridine synthase n=1 Tax=Bacillus sp. V5-8f TaxID=2053044 RepID=UPI00267FE189|nr:RluA family pseudouridine synthase [Bacillus sp. V5-8f]